MRLSGLAVHSGHDQVRVRLLRGQQGHEGPPRREGCQPRRDDHDGPAGAARVHDHHRGLPGVPRPGRRAGRDARRGGDAPGHPPGSDGPGAGRPGRPAARERAQWREVLDAGDDGHRPEPRAERPIRRRPRETVRGRRPLRARRLPPVHPDVREDRDGRARGGLRGGPGPREGAEGLGHAGHRPRRRRPHGADR